MPRPRKPTKVLELSGAFDQNPQRRAARENEPTDCDELGPPPEYFDENHRAVWFELIAQAPGGVLTNADHTLVEVATRIKCKMRYLPGTVSPLLALLLQVAREMGMDEAQIERISKECRKLLYCSSQEVALLSSLLTRMGMTPADRSRVSAKKKQDSAADPLAEFARELQQGKRLQ